MILRILPTQVPKFWEQIKFAAMSVDNVPESDRELYLNKLLHSLLNNKAQCFIRVSDERELLALAITKIAQDDMTGEKALFLNALYSFKKTDDNEWKSDASYIATFARNNDCKKLITYSNNEKVYEIVKTIGFEERFRCFTMGL